MKKFMVLTGIAFFIMAGFSLYGAKPSFSGVWTAEKDKDTVLSIKHKGKNLNITEITKKDKKEVKHAYKYVLDGKEHVQTTKKGVEIKSKAVLGADNRTVKINRTEISLKEGKEKKEILAITLILSKDNKTLTVETEQIAPKKKKPQKQVFYKSKDKPQEKKKKEKK